MPDIVVGRILEFVVGERVGYLHKSANVATAMCIAAHFKDPFLQHIVFKSYGKSFDNIPDFTPLVTHRFEDAAIYYFKQFKHKMTCYPGRWNYYLICDNNLPRLLETLIVNTPPTQDFKPRCRPLNVECTRVLIKHHDKIKLNTRSLCPLPTKILRMWYKHVLPNKQRHRLCPHCKHIFMAGGQRTMGGKVIVPDRPKLKALRNWWFTRSLKKKLQWMP